MRKLLASSTPLPVENDPRLRGSFSILEWGMRTSIIAAKLVRSNDHGGLALLAKWPSTFAGSTCVTVPIAANARRCTMQFTQTDVDKKATKGPWRDTFETLARILRET